MSKEEKPMSRTVKWFGFGVALLMMVAVVPLASAAAPAPGVTPYDQPVLSSRVVVEKVVSDGPGWMVIHADKNGAPGDVIGVTSVASGETNDVVVAIDASKATPTLWAMLHIDAGKIGVYEFPGADVPAKGDMKVISPAFKLTPMVWAEDQALTDNRVVIVQAFSDGPGWMVIHSQKDGKPGPVIGFSPVRAGENENLVVAVDPAQVTDTLYAMLHIDTGKVGVYEFPGADVPAPGDIQSISPTFKITGGMPAK
jgi:hypothetical protein